MKGRMGMIAALLWAARDMAKFLESNGGDPTPAFKPKRKKLKGYQRRKRR